MPFLTPAHFSSPTEDFVSTLTFTGLLMMYMEGKYEPMSTYQQAGGLV